MRGGESGREMLLDVRGLTVSFSGCARPVLDRVDLALAGGRLTIVGESGAGKSTLLRVLFGELRGWSGSVRVCGIEVGGSLGAGRLARRQLGVILQEPRASLHPGRSVVESVAEPMVVLGGSSWVEARRRGGALLEAMGVSPGRFGARPGELSGGECQRAAIARAVCRPVGLLLADEATANLDPELGVEVVRLVKGWTDGGDERGGGVGGGKPGLVWVTHRLQEAEVLGGKVVVLYGGRVVEVFEGFTGWGGALHPYTRRLVLASGQSLAAGGGCCGVDGEVAPGFDSAFGDESRGVGKGELVQCGEGHWVAGGTIRGPAH